MLAYLLWHRPTAGVEREAYEDAAQEFHRSLAHTPPAGLRGSALYRLKRPAWFAQAGGAEDEEIYEDWYLVEDFTALGVLNETAVAHGHRSAHDQIARRFGAGAGGLYGLLDGHAHLGASDGVVDEPWPAIWIARPPGAPRAEFGELLADGIDPRRSSLWRRALVFGPAPEYCLLAPEPTAGISATRLPAGWSASVCLREVLWRG